MKTNRFKKGHYKDELRTNKSWIVLTLILLIGLGILGQLGFFLAMFLMFLIHWFRNSNLYELGLERPKSWIKTILISLLLTFVILGIFSLLLNPMLFEWFPPESKNLVRYESIKGNTPMLLLAILSSWITAGFAEEIIWRGYILRNVAELLGNRNYSWIISLLFTSVVFGLLHFIQGPIGILQTGIVGFIFGIIFIVNGKRNLWMNIVIHGTIDTISMIALYLGLA